MAATRLQGARDLTGYFSRDGEFMEEGREHPFGKAT
jgi:hypothetical protein